MMAAEDLSEMTSKPAPDWSRGGGTIGRDVDVAWAMVSYLGAIFGGPLIPLVVYALQRKESSFMRYHAARAVNISVSAALYLFCCAILGGMLALDSVTTALAIALPLAVALWLIMLRYLIRGVFSAHRGEPFEVPGWLCATIVKSALGSVSRFR